MKKYTLKQKEIKLNDDYEVIVVGGGPAGCSAAIASARKGAKTLLVEATSALGGMGTMGLVPSWAPVSDKERVVYRGIAEEFIEAYKKEAGIPENNYSWVSFYPEVAKRIYDEKVIDSGADIIFNTMLSAVEAESGEVKAIILSNKSGLTAYSAKVYIDCTGDADLAFWAGAELITDGLQDGYQPATHCFNVTNVNMDEYKNGPSLHDSNPDSPIRQSIKSGKYKLPDAHCCNNELTYGTVGFNAGHLWNVDNTNPENVSKALIDGRKLANNIHSALVEFHPKAFKNSEISATAPLMGIRETRRILGDYILNANDYAERKTFEDEICRNCYYIDVHHSSKEADKHATGDINLENRRMRYDAGESHGVPYRCLTPKGLINVLVAGRCISTDRPMQGSIRVMPPCMCTGEAAGKAAVLATKREDNDVHKIDVMLLRQQIIGDGGYIK